MSIKTNLKSTLLRGVILLVLAVLPTFASEYLLHIAILILLYAYLSTAWNIVGGYAGQHSLGHSLFLGFGAYTSTYLFTNFGVTPWLGLWAGSILASVVGLIVGYLCFRYGLKGPYFALVTIALAEGMASLVSNLNFLGGAMGMEVKWEGSNFRAMQFESKWGYYYIILILFLTTIWLVNYISRRRFGYYLIAVRENEDAAEALGVNTLKVKIQALVLSAALTAIGGTFFAEYFTYISPRSVFGEGPSIQILLFAIVGGIGTVWGPALGALLLVPIAEISRAVLGGTFAGSHLLLYGITLVVIMMVMPKGLITLIPTIRSKLGRSKINDQRGF